LLCFALVLLTWVIYLPVRTHDFVSYDDPDYLTRNHHVLRGLTPGGIHWAFTRIHGEGTYWHPLTWMSHMLDVQLFGLNPGAHHLVNLFFHSINVLLLFLVFYQFTGALWRSAIVAALFAVHPLQVDAVAWIAERKTLLAAMFWLLSMGAYGLYAQRKNRRLSFYVLAFLLFALGLMCKPILVTWPCAMLLMDFWPLKRFGWRDGQPLPWKEWKAAFLSGLRFVPEKLPFLLLAFVSSFVTFESHKEMGMTEISGLPLWLRFENAFVSYARYLKKAVWPNDLAVLYPHPGEWPDSVVIISVVVLVILTAAVLHSLRRRPYLAVGWFWFIGVLVPAIGIVQVGAQAMADRFAYLPLIGFIIMVVWGAHEYFQGVAGSQGWTTGAAVAALGSCILLTSHQLTFWKDSVALYQHTVKVTDQNYVILNNLGYELAIRNRLDEAEQLFRKVLSIKKDFPEAHQQLALALESKSQYEEALFHYREAARLNPQWAAPYAGLGNLYWLKRQTNDALQAYETSLRLFSKDRVALFQYGSILLAQGRTGEALARYREALSLKPDWAELMNNLAWIYATNPDPKFRDGSEAVRLAEGACGLTKGTNVLFIGTLAAAYAEAGQFDAAEKSAVEAIRLALSQGNPNLADTNRQLLAIYQKKQAYREGQP
jgi:tetratricopeptide (TPR) repeat protein